ncbi:MULTISPECIES: GMC family oxidoreductase [unclassified Mesorhizobium]|uniref:GMC family oxidoreductase n=1 Tax=unclassified Mesorhizobium TaxID=325217 RepID=UPI000F75F778|nr:MULTISPECIES: GMC family oxidoreductase [unclassified Mesorhizobium]AZO05200.1 GMC family oxidoreductase [Mesorhizobium sp. M2A.F.Ca.ET.043.02.1.1]RUW39400.1 GMC family oxidoreductase [Mesorhizobium sp. M2A.F.Ca.ET.015.02.1.1]RUW77722.1 GMC family oxidoreductase [Mesorhizobium sp. M2A.F.Ca.ET.067.02.1.1]RVC98319.1 GMC family oxidoreductase [Mesorhizobium sp. M2A.F.Ca.ET.017.03.2.1]RVD11463.1 GMC family oxidoreductase [Mesorhizobium sp. M2A.F.Ca.ET.029.05.1.1]
MPSSLIIGSGPAAAAAVLALSEKPDEKITVFDPGTVLNAETQEVIARLSRLRVDDWDEEDVRRISQQPKRVQSDSLPEKRSYGSDFPFANKGQLDGVHSVSRVNPAVISSAYGGFSNVWGAQIMPFSAATFKAWPFGFSDMEEHYRTILGHIPFAGESDDLEEWFPLIGSPDALPPLAPRTQMVLANYDRHRERVRSTGITIGRARLAFAAPQCQPCSLCMTGCPRSLIFSASHSFDRFRRNGRIDYRSGLLAVRVEQEGDTAVVHARELSSGRIQRFTADRVFVGCGAIGTTRLMLGSLGSNQPVHLSESAQFVLPMISMKPTPDPRARREFTLNQFTMVIARDDEGLDVSQIHFYPFNQAYYDALPGFLKHRAAAFATDRLLSRLTVGLGYLPSWASPKIRVSAQLSAAAPDELPQITLTSEGFSEAKVRGKCVPPMLPDVISRIRRAAPYLDLWPVTPRMLWSGGAKSYHFGGSFPHANEPDSGSATTDRLGRLARWDRIHLIDGSVFPNVPATTFTLTVMANSHRIAREAMQLTA